MRSASQELTNKILRSYLAGSFIVTGSAFCIPERQGTKSGVPLLRGAR